MSAIVRNYVRSPVRLAVAVASFGGLVAVIELLRSLPECFSAPLLLAQHSGARDDPDRLTRILANRSRLPVQTARHGAAYGRGITVMPGGVTPCLVAQGSCLAFEAGDGMHSGDALLASAAAALGPAVVAVILSGMQRDGTEGVRAIKAAGGRVLVQEPSTARAPQMPASAIATGCVDFVLSPGQIASALVALAMGPGAADYLAVATPSWASFPSRQISF